MAMTNYDGTCKNCGSDLSVWIEVDYCDSIIAISRSFSYSFFALIE